MHDGRERLLNAGGIVFRTIIERSIDSRRRLYGEVCSCCFSCPILILMLILILTLMLLLRAVRELVVKDHHGPSQTVGNSAEWRGPPIDSVVFYDGWV